ncbi:MAG: hypothetical protein K2I35_02200 [Duncaniella sp.]|nr:hypothetical protein [Duncaniella sp.]
MMKRIVPEYVSSPNSPYAFLDCKESPPDTEIATITEPVPGAAILT